MRWSRLGVACSVWLAGGCALAIGADFGDKTMRGADGAPIDGALPEGVAGDGGGPIQEIGKALRNPARIAVASDAVHVLCSSVSDNLSPYGLLMVGPANGTKGLSEVQNSDITALATTGGDAYVIGRLDNSLPTSGLWRVGPPQALTQWGHLATAAASFDSTIVFAGYGADGVWAFDVTSPCSLDDAGVVSMCARRLGQTSKGSIGIGLNGANASSRAFVYACDGAAHHYVYSVLLDGSQANAQPTPLFELTLGTSCPMTPPGLAMIGPRAFFALGKDVYDCDVSAGTCAASPRWNENVALNSLMTNGTSVFWAAGSALRMAGPPSWTPTTLATATTPIVALTADAGYAYWTETNLSVRRVPLK